MTDRFLTCLAATLREETGYVQPVGGPYRRRDDGSTEPPDHPDGCAFDDDPDDTGGRTGMGILQREYDAWRRARGYATADVWHISDEELTAIYWEQFWSPSRCDDLPAGLALAVFDMAVNCGPGRAIKALQRALGVTIDGHIGVRTIEAAHSADPVDLIVRFCEERLAWHRQCKTWWKFGKGWTARTKRISSLALAATRTAQAQRIPVTNDNGPIGDWQTDVSGEASDHAESRADLGAPRATPPPRPTPTTAPEVNASQAIAGLSLPQMGTAAAQAAQQSTTPSGFLLALAANPLFWTTLITLGTSIWLALKSRKRIALEGH